VATSGWAGIGREEKYISELKSLCRFFCVRESCSTHLQGYFRMQDFIEPYEDFGFAFEGMTSIIVK